MNVLASTIQKEQRYLYIASAVLVALFVLYTYFVSATVMHVVLRKEIDHQISDMHSRISSLEAEYIAAQHAVSADIALLPGFVEASDKIFIDRAPDTLVLSTNIDNIQ